MASNPHAVFAVAFYRDGKNQCSVSIKVMVRGKLIFQVVEPPTDLELAWRSAGLWLERLSEIPDCQAEASAYDTLFGAGAAARDHPPGMEWKT